MGASRKGEREPGKSDEIDALAVARAVVKDGVEQFPAAYLDERAMEIRLLADHRNDLIAERPGSRTGCNGISSRCAPSSRPRSRSARCQKHASWTGTTGGCVRLTPETRARVAREQVAQIRSLTRHANTLENELLALIKTHRPQLLAETGCGR